MKNQKTFYPFYAQNLPKNLVEKVPFLHNSPDKERAFYLALTQKITKFILTTFFQTTAQFITPHALQNPMLDLSDLI